MKKVVSFLLALTMIIGSMGMTFAAPATTFNDVEDVNVEKAVERLKAFGVVDGYEDGTYRPEKEVTREEFAKLMVTALGMEHAAKAVQVADFSDVEAGRWSAGYIAVAAGQGIILGDPSGTFRPEAKVSYAEAVTMLVRALGYQDSFLKGTWPGNFVAKAAETGITSKVKFADAAGFANRGEVAILLNNALDADVIKVQSYEGTVIKYEESDKTLLEDKLDIEKLENIRLVANDRLDSGLNKNEVKVITVKDNVEYDGKKHDKYYGFTFDIQNTFNPENFLGREITAYLNDDNEIIYAEDETAAGNVVKNDRLDDEYNKENKEQISTINKKKINVYSIDGDKNEDNNVDKYQYIYINGERIDNDKSDLESELQGDIFGTFVLDNNQLVFADLVKFEETDYVVQSVDTDKERITYIKSASASDDRNLDLKTKYDAYSIFLSDGTPLELKDLKEYDVFNIAEVEENGDDNIARIYVWRDAVEGKFGKMTGGKLGTKEKDIKATIGDKSYELAEKVTYTMDEGDDYTAIGKDGIEDLDDFYGEEVLALKNWEGKICFISGDAKATSKEQYGVILRCDSGIRDEVKLYTANGEKVVYKFEETKDFRTVKERSEGKIAILRYELNKDGEIAGFDDGKEYVYIYDSATAHEIKKDFGRTSVRVRIDEDEDKTFYVKDNTAFFDMQKVEEEGVDKADTFEWEDIKDKEVSDSVKVLYAEDKDKKGELGFLAIFDGLSDIKDDTVGAYFIETYREDGTNYAKVAIFDQGVKTYELKNNNNYLEKRAFAIQTITGNKIEIVTNNEEYPTVSGRVHDVSSSRIKIGDTWLGVKKNAVIYDGSKEIDLSDIDEDDFVVAVINKGEIEALSLVYSVGSSERLIKAASIKEVVGKEFKIKDDWYTLDLDEAIGNDGYLNNKKPDLKEDLTVGDEVEFIYNKNTNKVKALWLKQEGDGTTTGPEEPEEITATAVIADKKLGVTKVVITVDGAEGKDVEKVLVNKEEVRIQRVEGKEVTILSAEDVKEVKIFVEGKGYKAELK